MLHQQQECFKHPSKIKQCKTDLHRYRTPVLWGRLEEKNREEIEPMEAEKVFSLALPAEWQIHMSIIYKKKTVLELMTSYRKGSLAAAGYSRLHFLSPRHLIC